MLTINEIKKNVTKVFARQNTETKKANMETMSYIEHLSKATSTNIAVWDIEEVFGDAENKKASLELIKNKNEINKRFFEQKTKMTVGSTKEIESTLKLLDQSIGASLDSFKNTRISIIENDILSNRRNIEEKLNSMNKNIENITNLNKEYDILLGVSTKDRIMANIEEILKGNFYQFESFSDNVMTFTTKNDVVCSLINSKAGLNFNVNFGKFKITINLLNFKLKVLPHSGNLKLNGHHHPYVGDDGIVCFGDGQSRANALLESMDVYGVLSLLAAVLTNYSEDAHPFVSLNSFQAEADRISKGLPPSSEDENEDL